MRVLFVSSGRGDRVSVLVKNQGESLKAAGVELDYFTVRGTGLSGYIRSLLPLRRTVRQGGYDIVHAHYSVSAFLSLFAGSVPKVASLMGSDVHNTGLITRLIRKAAEKKWDATIVKSEKMFDLLGVKSAVIIPNGVNTEFFKSENKSTVRRKLGIPEDTRVVLFVSTHDRPEKNLGLARAAVSLLKNENVELLYLKGVEQTVIADYLNAVDVLLLTSVYEGSPNIIKEAMACNCPVVSTDVGDVRKLTEGVSGCYLAAFNRDDVADKILEALRFGGKTNGRERLFTLGLDAPSVAIRIIDVYRSVLKGR